VISYTVHATVGGKLAQIGQRLIDATAKKMARQFFESFAAYLEVEGAPGQAAAEATAPPAAAKVAGGQGLFWGMMGVALVILWVVNH
ncbi:MAG: SRPBCC domain-containing protein, partial [Alphaproteobacteria bacterium]